MGQYEDVGDLALDAVVMAVAVALSVGGWRLWRRGRTQIASAMAILVFFLLLLEALMIWATATGFGGTNGM
jgi:hypothetical protein